MEERTLLTLVKSGEYDEVARQVTSKELANERDEDGYTLLSWAAQEGKDDIVQLLIERGADPHDSKNRNESTPLHCAVSRGHLSIVKQLVHPEDINKINKLGLVPLFYALDGDHSDIAKLLIDQGAKLDVWDDEGQTLLGAVIEYENEDLAGYMLEHGANVNQVNKKGDAPLHLAIQEGNLSLVKLLLAANNIVVNVKDAKGETPLHRAVRQNRPDIVSLLLTAKGIDVNLKNDNQNTPLHLAVQMDPKIVKSLLDAKADANIGNKYKRTPLHNAVYLQLLPVVGLLAPLSQLNPDEMQRRRHLSVVFNNSDLNNILEQFDSISYEGGYNAEFFPLVSPQLKKFIALTQANLLNDCLERTTKVNYYNSDSQQIITDLDKDQTVTLLRGFSNHCMPFTFKKTADDQYSMTIIDRGALSVSSKTTPNKVCAAITIGPISKDHLPKVIDMVEAAWSANQDEAKKILHHDIPARVGFPYKNDERTVQTPFKRGQCYFENNKSLLLAEFINAYGEGKGSLLYKQFDVMLHEEALKNYIDYFRKSQQDNKSFQESVYLCQRIIAAKKNKLLQLAIHNNDADLIKQLLKEGVDIAITKLNGKKTDAYQYAIIHGNDDILDLLKHHKQYLTSIELADDFAKNPKIVSLNELAVIKQKDPLRYKTFHAKHLLDAGQLGEAQLADPIFFDHYFIQGVLHQSHHIKSMNVKFSLSDGLFLQAQTPYCLMTLATHYKDGYLVPVDLLTTESLYQTALSKVDAGNIKSPIPRERIVNAIQEIRDKQLMLKETYIKTNDAYLKKWNPGHDTRQNLINIFNDFNSFGIKTFWNNPYAKEINQLSGWLKQSDRTTDDIRSRMLDRRFELLQSGIAADSSIIKLLNFTVMQCTPGFIYAPANTIQVTQFKVINK